MCKASMKVQIPWNRMVRRQLDIQTSSISTVVRALLIDPQSYFCARNIANTKTHAVTRKAKQKA